MTTTPKDPTADGREELENEIADVLIYSGATIERTAEAVADWYLRRTQRQASIPPGLPANQPPPLPQVDREELKRQIAERMDWGIEPSEEPGYGYYETGYPTTELYWVSTEKELNTITDVLLALFDQHLQVAVDEAREQALELAKAEITKRSRYLSKAYPSHPLTPAAVMKIQERLIKAVQEQSCRRNDGHTHVWQGGQYVHCALCGTTVS